MAAVDIVCLSEQMTTMAHVKGYLKLLRETARRLLQISRAKPDTTAEMSDAKASLESLWPPAMEGAAPLTSQHIFDIRKFIHIAKDGSIVDQ